jgi:flagellar hook-length control protein FliK
MNATALNAASIQPTGQTGVTAGAGVQGAGTGPLAGFEALLAALFPTGAAPTAPASTAAAEGGDVSLEDVTRSADDLDINPEVAFADLSYGTANANLLAGVIAVQTPISPVIPTSVQALSTGDSSAAPRASAPIPLAAGTPTGVAPTPGSNGEVAPLAPDLASGSLADGSEQTVITGSTPRLDKWEQASPNPAAQTIRSPGASLPEPAPAPRTSAQAPSPTPDLSTAEATPATPVVTPGASETSVQVAGLTGRPEQPSPAPRSARAERAKATSEVASASAPTPLPVSDAPDAVKPVQALAAATPDRIDADEPKVSDKVAAAESPDGVLQSESRAASQTLAPATLAGHVVRGSPETVATLAAQIIKKLEGQSTRFDLELNPGGLGKVDVRIDIGAHGRITAAMTFDNPQAASDLKARANELQRAMEQAGFDMSGGMSFDVAGDRGQQQRQAWQDQTDNNGQAFRGQAFRAALDTAGAATDAAVNGALRLRRGVNAGLDLRI